MKKRSAAEKVATRHHKPRKIQNPINVLAKVNRWPDKLIYPNEVQIQTSRPPEKRHVDLTEFIQVNNRCYSFTKYNNYSWFENANFIFHPDYNEGGPLLTFAQHKDFYLIHRTYSPDHFFDLEDVQFDSRFLFPDLPQGVVRFGNYREDKSLGRLFVLTEPKDAKDILLSITEMAGTCEWLKDDQNVRYFRHETKRFNLHVVLPIGSRIQPDHEFVVVHPSRISQDRERFTQLFETKLQRATDFNFPEIQYKRPLTETERDSRDHRADYVERLQVLSQKYSQICEIRRIGTSDPFDEPVSIQYKGHTYYYNDGDISRLEAIISTELEFYQKLKERLDFVENLVRNALKPSLEEFDVKAVLQLEREHFLADFTDEKIVLIIAREDVICPIYRHKMTVDEFNIPTEGTITQSLAEKAEQFFAQHREKFHAFKNLYETNMSYCNLVNTSASQPKLDYDYIFRDCL